MVTLQIWTNRLLKEFDGIESRLPSGMSLSSHSMSAETGVCRAVFEAVLTAKPPSSTAVDKGSNATVDGVAGSDTLDDGGDDDGDTSRAPRDDKHAKDGGKLGGDGDGEADHVAGGDNGPHLTAMATKPCSPNVSPLAFKVELNLDIDTRYPFEAPVIRVLEGVDVIPTDALSEDCLVLADKESWSPSDTIVSTLKEISDMVIHAREMGIPTGEGDATQFRLSKALENGTLRPGSVLPVEAIGGCLFPCTPPPQPLFSGSIMASLRRRPLDRYIGVTDRQVLEMEAHRTRLNESVIITAIDLRTLSKLKFRRGTSVTFVLRGGAVKEFLIPQSHECVTAVTEKLGNMGIAGHQTLPGAEKQVDNAKLIMATLGRKEIQLERHPSLDLVQECMDLFRQAAELYSAVDDHRHEQVVGHMHAFLQRPDVITVLEGKAYATSAEVNMGKNTSATEVGDTGKEDAAASVRREALGGSPALVGSKHGECRDGSAEREERAREQDDSGALDELQDILSDTTGGETIVDDASINRSTISENTSVDAVAVSEQDPAGKSTRTGSPTLPSTTMDLSASSPSSTIGDESSV